MARSRFSSLRIVLATVVLGGCYPYGGGGALPPAIAPGGATPGQLFAGAAVVDLTPASGAPLAGYSAPQRRRVDPLSLGLAGLALVGICIDPTPSDSATFFKPANGALAPIRARALVLKNGTRKLAIVKLDLIGVSRRLRDDLATTASALGIGASDLVLVATHTHSGPGALADQRLWQVAATDCLSDSDYAAFLAGTRAALLQANSALVPAAIGVATTAVATATVNRRGRPGIYDPELGLLKVVATDGTPIAALLNFAIHGTALGEDNLAYSPDCMGAIEEVVEAGIPGAVAIFTNGAEGDVAPAVKGDAGMQQIGSSVGGAAVALWPTTAVDGVALLDSAWQEVPMPRPRMNSGFGCLPLPGGSDTLCDIVPFLPITLPLPTTWVSTVLPFQALRIGNTVFAALPGEPITEIGWQIKSAAKASGFTHAFVLSLANDHAGYFATLAEYQRGKYEGQATLFGPMTGEIVTDSATSVVAEVW